MTEEMKEYRLKSLVEFFSCLAVFVACFMVLPDNMSWMDGVLHAYMVIGGFTVIWVVCKVTVIPLEEFLRRKRGTDE